MPAEAEIKTDAKPKNKGGRPPKEIDVEKVLASPQGQQAIAAAASAAVEAMIPQLAASLATARASNPLSAAGGDGDMDFVRKLALAIGEISDQGTQRKRVAPEILAKRSVARERMVALLVKARADGFEPHYRVIAKTYLSEVLVEPFKINPNNKAVEPTEIWWDGAPNECMVPLDERTTEIFNAYMESIGGMTVVAKTHDGRAFIPDMSPVVVTPNGLTVKGGGNVRRQVSSLPDSNNGSAPESRLRMREGSDPNASEIRVLGTVMPAAKVQNLQGQGVQGTLSR